MFYVFRKFQDTIQTYLKQFIVYFIQFQRYELNMKKVTYYDNNKWQDKVGYCRALKIGNHVFISGTVANDENGNPLYIGDVAGQTRTILLKFEEIMAFFAGSLADVVRTRIFTTDISKWEEIGSIHGEFFSKIKPATTMVEVSKLISPEYMVEIEAEAIVES